MAVIYRHLKPCGEVFYIGIGRDKERAYVKKNRTEYWNSVVNKHGYEVQILKSDLSLEDAKELEIILIGYYGRRDLGKGTLVNMTDGGDGANISEKTKEKLRNINLGKVQSKETIDARMKVLNAKIDEKVVCICTETLKTWGSIARCAKDLSMNYSSLQNQIKITSPTLNYTSIMLYSDYTGDRVKIPYKGLRPKGKKQCINTLTGEIFKSKKEAAAFAGIKQKVFSSMLLNRTVNKTYFMMLSDYNGQIHYPEKVVPNRGIKILVVKTGEVINSKVDLAKYLGMSGTTSRRYLDKHKEDFIILQ